MKASRLILVAMAALACTACNQILGIEDLTQTDASQASPTLQLRIGEAPIYLVVGSTVEIPFEIQHIGIDSPVTISGAGGPSTLAIDDAVILPDAATGTIRIRSTAEAEFKRFPVRFTAAAAGLTSEANVDVEVVGIPGTPDVTFGTAGEPPIDESYLSARSVFCPDDKTVYQTEHSLTRLLSDGTLDKTFGVNGHIAADPRTLRLETTSFRYARADASRRYVVAGDGAVDFDDTDDDLFVVRFTAQGQPDPAWPPMRLIAPLRQHVKWAAAAEDGSVFVMGYESDRSTGVDNKYFLRKFTPAATVDLAFGINGRMDRSDSSDCAPLATSDGGIIVCGANLLEKFDRTGQPDKAFGTEGRVTVDGRVRFVAVHGDVLLASGLVSVKDDVYHMAVWRMDSKGKADMSFGDVGRLVLPRSVVSRPFYEDAIHVEPRSDGSIDGVGFIYQDTLGYTRRPRFFHILANGKPDPLFGQSGIADDTNHFGEIYGVARSDRHRVVLLGGDDKNEKIKLRRYWY